MITPDSKQRRALVWLRRGLRLEDQHALSRASIECESVAVVFVLDPAILERQESLGGRRRLTFLKIALQDVDAELKKCGSRLVLLHGEPSAGLAEVAESLNITDFYYNRDYTPFAKRRDAAVENAMADVGVNTHALKDLVVFEGRDVLKDDGTPYRVFTPYSKRWLSHLDASHITAHQVHKDRFLSDLSEVPGEVGFDRVERLCDSPDSLWLTPGRQAGLARLRAFLGIVQNYQKARDYPAAKDQTSHLSVHLKFGTLSIRELLRALQPVENAGEETWRKELIWREFYHMITDQFPHVAQWNFNPKTDTVEWPGTDKHFQAWCEGQTGYPLVDAAMRHLKQTGWMHNRLRMVVASFLTKDLLVHWRRGEAWFREQLLDYDFAPNNGGWQWAASTGCDAQPYFRVFNPVSQSKKYDPEGEFIRENVPELAGFETRDIHWPHDLGDLAWEMANCKRADYPAPIVVHAEQREKAIQLFKT